MKRKTEKQNKEDIKNFNSDNDCFMILDKQEESDINKKVRDK